MKAHFDSSDLEAIRLIIRSELGSFVQPRLMTVDQAARYVGRPVQGFRKFAKTWRIPVASPDRRILFDREDLDRMVERWKTPAA
jgi:hypothetical protein